MWLYCQLNIKIVLIEVLSLHDKALWQTVSLSLPLKDVYFEVERCYGMFHYNFNSREQDKRASDQSFVSTSVYKNYWLVPRSLSSRSLSRALRTKSDTLQSCFFSICPFPSIIEISQCCHPVVVFTSIRNVKRCEMSDFSMQQLLGEKTNEFTCIQHHSVSAIIST